MPKFNATQLGLIIGPLFFIICWLLPPPDGLSKAGFMVAGATAWMAAWWLTEAVPMYLTAMLPMALFPLSGAVDIQTTAAPFGSYLVWLLLCGFTLAAAIEKWNLHQRIALGIILRTGTAPSRIIMGFMIATAFLSMWISNTATSVMMVPIGIAVAATLSGRPGGDDDDFGKALMLSIAYSASVGGMSSLVGTPTNLIFASAVQEMFEIEVTFQKWMLIGVPVASIILVGIWYYLTQIAFSFRGQSTTEGKRVIEDRYRALGRPSSAEKRVGLVFGLVAVAWICRSYLLKPIFPLINDTTIGLIGVVALFLIPAGVSSSEDEKESPTLLDWATVQQIPWGVLLLIGGGLAIAQGFTATDLAAWIGERLEALSSLPFFLLLLLLISGVNFLTEVTSNMATTSILMPILGVTATAIGVDPLILMAAATLAAGCAFMLPIATPPNAVVFGSGYLQMKDMVRVGFGINVFSILVIALLSYFYLGAVWS